MGPVNEPLVVACGLRFVRIGVPFGAQGAFWVAPGRTVRVTCRDKTTVEMRATHRPPAR
jgi:hypothetical protein